MWAGPGSRRSLQGCVLPASASSWAPGFPWLVAAASLQFLPPLPSGLCCVSLCPVVFLQDEDPLQGTARSRVTPHTLTGHLQIPCFQMGSQRRECRGALFSTGRPSLQPVPRLALVASAAHLLIFAFFPAPWHICQFCVASLTPAV